MDTDLDILYFMYIIRYATLWKTQIFGETEASCHPFISIKPQFSLGSRQSWLFAKFCCPLRNRLNLYLRFHPGKNICSPEVVQFLRFLLRHLRKPIVLLWDQSPVHRAGALKKFLKRYRRIHAYDFPGYAPNLIPMSSSGPNLKAHWLTVFPQI